MNKLAAPKIDADFWDDLFTKGNMPWDKKQAPKELRNYLAQLPQPANSQSNTRVFIPGCGAAYEVRSFLEHGWAVTAMDYSEQAVHMAKLQLGTDGDVIVHGDVFTAEFEQSFDVIYERAFLAALPRELWDNYFTMLCRLLSSGGFVIGYFVISDEYRSRFPPFCLRTGELAERIGSDFELVLSLPVVDSVPVFAGKEHWMIWRRK